MVGPGDEPCANLGEVDLPFLTEDGRSASGCFQVVDKLNKTLVAVSDSCDKGNMSIFDNDESVIIDRSTPEGREIRRLVAKMKNKVKLHRRNGVYLMPMWLKDGEGGSEAPFARPGGRA